MNMNRMHVAVAAALIGSVALVGCNRNQETTPAAAPAPAATTTPAPAPAPATAPAIRVVSVDMGTAVDSNNRVTQATTNFSPNDTIYTAVGVDGNASGNVVKVEISHEGTKVLEETRTLNTSGPSHVEMHFTNASGWPTGRYRADVSVDGAVAQSRDFEVR